jgi:hypothetical protein
MGRTFLAAVILIPCAGVEYPSVPRPPSAQVINAVEPDPSQARPLDRWPNDADLAMLQSVEGKPRAVVLQVLGHPARVELRPNGEEVWEYLWRAACRIWLRNGVCTGTFYSGGF